MLHFFLEDLTFFDWVPHYSIMKLTLDIRVNQGGNGNFVDLISLGDIDELWAKWDHNWLYSLESDQSRESLFLASLEVYVDFAADVDCLDYDPDDFDVDADVECEMADWVNLAMVVGSEDQEVMVVGIE